MCAHVLTLNLLAPIEVHVGQVRAALEHLDVACSYVVRSCCRQFDSAKHCEEMNVQEYSQKCGLVRKYGCSSVFLTENSFADFHIFVTGRFVASNAIALAEVHGRQQVAAFKNLDVPCS